MIVRELLLKILLPRAAHRVYKLRVALGVAVARVPGLRVTEGGVYYYDMDARL